MHVRPGPPGKAEGRKRRRQVGGRASGAHGSSRKAETQTSRAESGANGLPDTGLHAKDRTVTYLTLRETPCGTPMLTVAPRMLWLEIFLSAPYSTTVPKKPALQGAGHSEHAMALSTRIHSEQRWGSTPPPGSGGTTDTLGPVASDSESPQAWDCRAANPRACLQETLQERYTRDDASTHQPPTGPTITLYRWAGSRVGQARTYLRDPFTRV